jgi:hypothetical protein
MFFPIFCNNFAHRRHKYKKKKISKRFRLFSTYFKTFKKRDLRLLYFQGIYKFL